MPKGKDSKLRIKELRKALGLTQEELANALGLSSGSTVTMWEAGIRNPSVDMLPQMARVLGCSIEQLYEVEHRSREKFASEKQVLIDSGKIVVDGNVIQNVLRYELVEHVDVLPTLLLEIEITRGIDVQL